jgi:hypothetical protein
MFKRQIPISEDFIDRNKKRKRKDPMESRNTSKNWGLQSLIDDEDWDSVIALLTPKDKHHERQLFQNISGMAESPLFIIFGKKKELCVSSKALCLRLIDIGGEQMVNRVWNRAPDESMVWTALYYACYKQGEADDKAIWSDVIKKLLEVGGKELVLMSGSYGTALHALLSHGPSAETSKVVHLLLTVGGKTLTLIQDCCGRTALHNLCLTGGKYGPEIVHQILAIGGEKLACMTAEDGLTALHCVTSTLDQFTARIVDLLLKFGGERLVMMKTHGVGWTILHMLCSNITKSMNRRKVLYDIICRLVDIGGDKLVLMHDEMLMTALHHFCKKREKHCLKILNRLLKVGGEELLSKIDGNGDTVLHIACKAGRHRKELIYQLLDVGREELLFMEQLDEPCFTAIEIEFSARDTVKEEIIDRFFEIGGDKAANLIERFE